MEFVCFDYTVPTWKQVLVAYLAYHPDICLEGTEGSHESLSGEQTLRQKIEQAESATTTTIQWEPF
jgi:hypothetical protein